MKLSKEELIEKINSLAIDDEIKISLMEDISDSVDVVDDHSEEVEELKAKYEELKNKYKERFLSGDPEEKSEEKEEDDSEEELKEEEVIDVKEI